MEYRQAWSHDSGKFSPPLDYSTTDGNIRDSISDSYDPQSSHTVSSSNTSRRLGSEDSPCGTDCSSETEILRPDESDPFAGELSDGLRNIWHIFVHLHYDFPPLDLLQHFFQIY